MQKIRVVVVDDSALVRSLIAGIINSQRDMECVGAANDPIVAREMIRELNPDVITLDVEMPKMDGLEFLGRLMKLRPMPVVMISTLTERGADVTMRALALGAIDFVAKPRLGVVDGIGLLADQIVDKIRIAAKAHVRRLLQNESALTGAFSVATKALQPFAGARLSTEKLICIGASTGGTEAIKEVLVHLPADAPGVVITQHMPPGFTSSFASRLNAVCALTVQEAVDGQRILPGHAYIAPGGNQFRVARSGADYVCKVEDGELVNRHKPSVDVLFLSVALAAGRNATGIILTGMGNDGAKGLRAMKDAGSYNYAQDEESCVVFGMPREAILHGGVDEILPLRNMAAGVLNGMMRLGVRHRL